MMAAVPLFSFRRRRHVLMNDRIFDEAGSPIVSTEPGLAVQEISLSWWAGRWEGVSLDSPFHRTTPSALSEVASRYFLDAQPPLLFREGNKFVLTYAAAHRVVLWPTSARARGL